jgi:S-adenosyl-L-methionine hydrolase (adenosine-forming)
MPGIITITTDFGCKDPFIAEMKGVILSIEPSATIIDITHAIEPFNILEAAFVIGSASRYFPSGTIHIVVVDPGVGSERRPIIVEAEGRLFVGPDNGVFSEVIRRERQFRCFHITNESYMLSSESPTFQGRDIFAPVAAWLMSAIQAADAGPQISDPVMIKIPQPDITDGMLLGQVIYIDQFGNAMTNISAGDLKPLGNSYEVLFKGHRLIPVNHYAQSSSGGLSCLVNSSDRLEIFTFRNNAARHFGIEKGDAVSARQMTS